MRGTKKETGRVEKEKEKEIEREERLQTDREA